MSEQIQIPGLRTTRDILDEMERPVRTNFRNDGRGFQAELVATAQAYRSRGVATMAKTDPPTRVVGSGKFRRVIYMENPFLDFVGTWTVHHGRAIFIEAKSIEDTRLKLAASGGLSETQWVAMKAWRRAGAACALLWRQAGAVRLYTPEDLLEAEKTGARSVVFSAGRPVPQGQGMAIWDFLPVLEEAIWPKKKVEENSK